MASKTNQSISDTLNYMLRNVSPSWGGATTLYLSMHTGAVGLGGDQTSQEADYVGYSRQPVSRNASGAWSVSSNGSDSTNVSLIQFGNCTGGTLPETLTHVALGESASGAGTVIATGVLASQMVVNLNINPQFPATKLAVRES